MSLDFRGWSYKAQEQCIDGICDILNKYKIPYRRDKLNHPRQQITLLPYANHAGFATQTDALLAIYAVQSIEIEKLKNELWKLRGMTKSEWKSEEEVAESLLHGIKRN